MKNTLFHLEEVLFPLVPGFYEVFEREAAAAFGQGACIPSTLLRFGSWVGAGEKEILAGSVGQAPLVQG